MTGNDGDEAEDEALTWAGGRDPSHYETPEAKPPREPRQSREPKQPRKLAVSDSAVSDTAVSDTDSAGTDSAEGEELPPGMSAVVLVALGVLGGIYLLYTIGWIVSLGRFLYRFTTEIELIAFHTEQVLAILAAPLWFTMTLLLTRGRKPAVRLVWLLVGALLLVPWSFVFGL